MIGWGRSTSRGPSVELQRQLERSQQQLDAVELRDQKVTQMSEWFERRQLRNHFGEDLAITYLRKGRHA